MKEYTKNKNEYFLDGKLTDPEDLIGKNVIVVSNLKPAVLCGVESNGMILAADDGDDIKVIFVNDITPGSRIR